MMSENGTLSESGTAIMDTRNRTCRPFIEPMRTIKETIMSFHRKPINTATVDRFRRTGIDHRGDPVCRRSRA
jgi:hypothetical protein